MKIVIDTREQSPLDFSAYPCTVEARTLDVGDYALRDLEHLAAIERKSIPDLVASLTHERPRFERELARARGLDLFAVVVEGSLEDVRTHNYRSQAPCRVAGNDLLHHPLWRQLDMGRRPGRSGVFHFLDPAKVSG